jgi:hypothetical protein
MSEARNPNMVSKTRLTKAEQAIDALKGKLSNVKKLAKDEAGSATVQFIAGGLGGLVLGTVAPIVLLKKKRTAQRWTRAGVGVATLAGGVYFGQPWAIGLGLGVGGSEVAISGAEGVIHYMGYEDFQIASGQQEERPALPAQPAGDTVVIKG